jgi:hypothetical protein
MKKQNINAYKILIKNLKQRHHFEDLGIAKRILLKQTQKQGSLWTGFVWLRTGTKGGLL